MKEKTILVFTCPECGNHYLKADYTFGVDIDEMWIWEDNTVDYYEGQVEDTPTTRYICTDCDWATHDSLESLFESGILTKTKEEIIENNTQ